MRGHQRARTRQPGHMDTARAAAEDLHVYRELLTGLPPGRVRDGVLDMAVGSAAVLHGVLSGMSRPGGTSPRSIGFSLNAEQGRSGSAVPPEAQLHIVHAAQESLADAAMHGVGAQIDPSGIEAAYA